MSVLAIEVLPGYTFAAGELLTIDKLNLLGRMTANLTGSIGSTSIGDGAVTTAKLATSALANSATGRSKMEDGFLSADAAGIAKMAAGYFQANATGLALMADGYFTADAAGRLKVADGFVTGPKLAASAGAVVGSARNLLAFNNLVTPLSKVTVTADEVLLKDGSSKPFLAQGVSLTIDMGATPANANALDTGSEAPSTWYYIWCIYDGTTVSGLFSTSATAPTLPGAYTYKALLGAVRNDGSSNFVTFYQQDRQVWTNEQVVFTGKAAVGSLTVISGADLTAMQAAVPPAAKAVRGVMGTTTTGTTQAAMEVAADANGLGVQRVDGQTVNTTGLGTFGLCAPFAVVLKTAQTVYWQGTSPNAYRLTVCGYSI